MLNNTAVSEITIVGLVFVVAAVHCGLYSILNVQMFIIHFFDSNKKTKIERFIMH